MLLLLLLLFFVEFSVIRSILLRAGSRANLNETKLASKRENSDDFASSSRLTDNLAPCCIADVSSELRYRNANTEKHVNCVAVPNIVSRLEWQARPPVDRVPLEVTPTPYVVIHHGGIAKRCYDQKSCSEIVRSYQNYHMDDREWFDIGYNFVIGEDGNVYEGRGWDYVGAHAPGYNTQSIGICVIGDFSGECGAI